MKHFLAAFLISAAPAFGQVAVFDYYPDPRLPVNPVSGAKFEVIDARGAGAPDFWCAAARYANNMGIREGRLYVDTPRGPSVTQRGEKGVVFTTQPTTNPTTSFTVSVREAGRNLSISHARRFCDAYRVSY